MKIVFSNSIPLFAKSSVWLPLFFCYLCSQSQSDPTIRSPIPVLACRRGTILNLHMISYLYHCSIHISLLNTAIVIL